MNRQANRQKGQDLQATRRQTERSKNQKSRRPPIKKRNRQKNNRQTDRQTDRQIERQADRQSAKMRSKGLKNNQADTRVWAGVTPKPWRCQASQSLHCGYCDPFSPFQLHSNARWVLLSAPTVKKE